MLRVLMVEDSPVDAKLIAAALRKGGHIVELERVDTEDALRAALRNATWDVVTCDWAMPGFDAPAALAVVKEIGIDIPFIIVSGTVGEELAVDAMRAGAHDYVIKDRLARLAPAVDRELRDVKARAAERQAAADLLASEARYRRIIETTNQGVWVIDTEGKTTFLNARMAELLGSTVSNVIGRTPAEFLDEDGREKLARAIATHKAGKPRQDEVQLRRADGSLISVLFDSSPVLDANNQYAGAFAMVLDISDRKRAEASLQISEARFRSLWESGIIMISIFTLDGTLVDVNDAFSRALGYSRDELLSSQLTWLRITPSEWLEVERVAQTQLASEGVATPWEKELITKDGTRLPMLAGAVRIDGAQGIGIGLDLSERKRVDKALHERLKAAALTAEVGIALTNQDLLRTMLQQCTEAIVKNLGAAFARIWTLDAGSNVLELQASAGMYTHLDGAHARVPVGQFKIGTIAEEREPHLTNDVNNDPRIGDPEWAARERMVSFAGYPLIVGGELVGVVAMFSREPLAQAAFEGLRATADAIAVGIRRNRAELVKDSLEAQLRQAQKLEAIGSLAGGIAHDFNNILSVILSYGDLIKSDLPPGHALLADIDEISNAASRAAGLTRQLLAFSRRQVLQPRVLNLNEVVRDLKSMLRRLLSEDIELAIVLDPTIRNVHADPGQIEQVLMNLVVNARDAMPQGGTVTIESANATLDAAFATDHVGVTPGPHTMLSVTDTGHGMDASVRARIFEPFFTTKEIGKGTGLGLSTVFGIIRQSNGTIWVDSEVGIGTSFRVYLPAVTAEIGVAAATPTVSPKRGTETILLCEDEDPVRTLVRAVLTRNGYQVLEARNGGEALMQFERNPGIHLLLTDVVMPMMSGRQLAERLLAIRPDLRVLYMSGYTDDAIVRHGVMRDEIELLQKPITPAVLTRRVRALLDAPPRGR
ncbi:MAG TPA: PAS domain S-box protein [Kofleriaceae bacterium]